MKGALFTTLVATAFAVCGAMPAEAPAPGEMRVDGLWVETRDEQGKVKVDFTPYDEIASRTLADREERSDIEERCEGCDPTRKIAFNVTDTANKPFLSMLPRGRDGSRVVLGDDKLPNRS
jgi:hypothetical protein